MIMKILMLNALKMREEKSLIYKTLENKIERHHARRVARGYVVTRHLLQQGEGTTRGSLPLPQLSSKSNPRSCMRSRPLPSMVHSCSDCKFPPTIASRFRLPPHKENIPSIHRKSRTHSSLLLRPRSPNPCSKLP